MKLKLILAAAVVFLCACAQHTLTKDGCSYHLRALLDMGSSTTKMNLSEVAACGGINHVARVLDNSLSVPIRLEAGKDINGAFTAETIKEAIKQFEGLRGSAFLIAHDQAPQYDYVEFAAVGTHAFRTATNAQVLADKLKELGIPVAPLSQAEEGELGFQGVKLKGIPEACRGKDLVVWDVGGGSQQITSMDGKGKINVRGISFSSESFKLRLISHFPKHANKSCKSDEPSPNPIGWKNSSQAETVAQSLAEAALGKTFLLQPLSQCLVGIGGVHNKAIAAQIQKHWMQIKSCVCDLDQGCVHRENSYSKKELQCLALKLSDKTDCDPEIKGPFSTSAVSNLYLVLGFMEVMNALSVETLSVNMAETLILSNDLPWSAIGR